MIFGLCYLTISCPSRNKNKNQTTFSLITDRDSLVLISIIVFFAKKIVRFFTFSAVIMSINILYEGSGIQLTTLTRAFEDKSGQEITFSGLDKG